jgi:hypothetical protein
MDATPAQLEFVNRELARFVQAGACRMGVLNVQRLRFHTLHSAKAGRQPAAVNVRPPIT